MIISITDSCVDAFKTIICDWNLIILCSNQRLAGWKLKSRSFSKR